MAEKERARHLYAGHSLPRPRTHFSVYAINKAHPLYTLKGTVVQLVQQRHDGHFAPCTDVPAQW